MEESIEKKVIALSEAMVIVGKHIDEVSKWLYSSVNVYPYISDLTSPAENSCPRPETNFSNYSTETVFLYFSKSTFSKRSLIESRLISSQESLGFS